MSFCRMTIDLPAGLAPREGVLAQAALQLTGDATRAAARIVAAAEAEAAALLAAAEADGRASAAALQRTTLEQGQRMLAALEQTQQQLLAQAGQLVLDLAQALFMRLAGELAPAERAALMLRQLAAEAPLRLVEPVLRLHPDDAAALAGQALPAGWSLKPDLALARQCCRLEAASGEWSYDFDAALLALQGGLGHAENILLH